MESMEIDDSSILLERRNIHLAPLPLNTVQEDNNWPRVQSTFSWHYFLKKYNTTCAPELALPLISEEGDSPAPAWRALHFLKDHYKGEGKEKAEEYGFTCLTMAKMLLCQFWPSDEELLQFTSENSSHIRFRDSQHVPNKLDFSKKYFWRHIQNIIGNDILRQKPQGKLLKWANIFEGMLFLHYVKQFPETSQRADYLRHAYTLFNRAKDLKTTRTVYLLLAEVLLDYQYIPSEMTREATEELARSYINEAFTSTENTTTKVKNPEKTQSISFLEKCAKPPYLKDIKYTPFSEEEGNPSIANEISPQNDHGTLNDVVFPTDTDMQENENHSTGSGLPPSQTLNEFLGNDPLPWPLTDGLQEYDFQHLIINQHASPYNLRYESNPINRVGEPGKRYRFNNRIFYLQNVSGECFRCFFNAMGLNYNQQAVKFAINADHPYVRWMVANDIMSALAHPEQLSDEIKVLPWYQAYLQERDDINLAQNTGGNGRVLYDWDNMALNKALERALSLETIKAFVRGHIMQDYVMMATLPDDRNLTDPKSNYTAIDAIAFFNNVGIKIYQPVERGLRLIHTFVPVNAQKIIYLYLADHHFQTFIPEEELELQLTNPLPPTKTSNQSNKEQTTDKLGFPQPHTLKKLYPQIEQPVQKFPELSIRKVLYAIDNADDLKDLWGSKITNKLIGEKLDIDPKRVSDIRVANDRRTRLRCISDKDANIILRTYLSHFQDIQDKKTTKREMIDALIGRSLLSEEIAKNKIIENWIIRNIPYGKETPSEEAKEMFVPEVVELYNKKTSLKQIHEKTGLPYKTIFSILWEKIGPDNFHSPIVLNVSKRALSENEIEELILNEYAEQGDEVSVLKISQNLGDYKIGYKTVDRVLTKHNKETTGKSKHFNPQTIQSIKNDAQEFSSSVTKDSMYRALARKYDATYGQIKDILAGYTYENDMYKTTHNTRQQIVTAYHQLTGQEKLRPVGYIQKALPNINLKPAAIRSHLAAAKLYITNHKAGKGAHNTLVQNIQATSKQRGLKRKLEETAKNLKKKRFNQVTKKK